LKRQLKADDNFLKPCVFGERFLTFGVEAILHVQRDASNEGSARDTFSF
jgi:hypothetical protein